MLELATTPTAFPDETNLETRACDGCDRIGYYPARSTSPPTRCPDCEREQLVSMLDDDSSHPWGRTRVWREIDNRDMLPVRDPRSGNMVTTVDVDSVPGEGSFVAEITQIVDRDCPECGYDRADKHRWQCFTFESGQSVTCRACGHVIEQESTL